MFLFKLIVKTHSVKVLIFVDAKFRGSSKLPRIVGSLYSWFHNWHKMII